jgi:hypothetical protein
MNIQDFFLFTFKSLALVESTQETKFTHLMYFKGPIWSTKVHKVLQSEKKKACGL